MLKATNGPSITVNPIKNNRYTCRRVRILLCQHSRMASSFVSLADEAKFNASTFIPRVV